MKVDTNKVLKMFENNTLDDYFETIMERSEEISCVDPKTPKSVYRYLNPDNIVLENTVLDKIYKPIRNTLFGISFELVNNIRRTMINNNMNREFINELSLIIDLNWTHKNLKARMRSLISVVLLIVAEEFSISVQVLANTSGYIFKICDQSESLLEKMCRIFDLEYAYKVPSSPLDVIKYNNFDTNSKYIIISDCLSEQMISKHIKGLIEKEIDLFFIFKVKGTEEGETLSNDNEIKLNAMLNDNFTNKTVEISHIDELKEMTAIEYFIEFIKGGERKSRYTTKRSANIKMEINDIPKVVGPDYIVLIKKREKYTEIDLPSINTLDLEYFPESKKSTIDMKMFNEKIQAGLLFSSLDSKLLMANKPTTYVPSSSGNLIHIGNFIKYILTGIGDGKFFKKKTGNKTRFYSVSIVIDCTTRIKSFFNKPHFISTLLTVLRGISEMSVHCIDIWVSGKEKHKICLGMDSNEIWSPVVLEAIERALSDDVLDSELENTLKHAIATLNSRTEIPVMFVLTNGDFSRAIGEGIGELVDSCGFGIIGVGCGYSIDNANGVFPNFIWCPKPDNIPLAINSLNRATENKDMKCSALIDEKAIVELESPTSKRIEERDLNLIKFINSQTSLYDFYASMYGNETDEMMNKIEVNDDTMELGRDNSFVGCHTLFIILYLSRNITYRRTGEIIDREITKENLVNGKDGYSPIKKIEQKGIKCEVVYDYISAINELSSGKYKVAIITCSPGDGKYVNENSNINHATSFIDCLHVFHQFGGGIFWFLENYPFTFEADLYFQKYFGIDQLCNPNKNEQLEGGNYVIRDLNVVEPEAGKFKNIGGDIRKAKIELRLDKGLTMFYEGRTLPKLDEAALNRNKFEIFAKESKGNACVLIRRNYEGCGKMIIDTAASKLFIEFTEEGTAHWISNGVVWLMNLIDPEDKTTVDAFKQEIREIVLEPKAEHKVCDFCLSILMDCTGSMSSFITSTKSSIIKIFQRLNEIKAESGIDEDSQIIGQFVGYRDFCDGAAEFSCSGLQTNFDNIYNHLNTVQATGGGDECEDVAGGITKAIEYMEDNNVITVCRVAEKH